MNIRRNEKAQTKIVRVGNEIYRKKQKKETAKKEKKNLKKLKTQMEKTKLLLQNMKYKEEWIDQLQHKKVKLEKTIERDKRIIFMRPEKYYRKNLQKKQMIMQMNYHRWITFLSFSGIWEKEQQTTEMSWMEKVKIWTVPTR